MSHNRPPADFKPKRHVLIVDGDPHVLDGYRRLVSDQHLQWDMSFCSSGTDALELLKAKAFDVLVTELQLPGINGVELMSRAIEVAPDVVRIVLTGYTNVHLSVEAADLAHQFLNKPCELDHLREAIEHGCEVQSMISSDRVKCAIGRVGKLPSPPIVYHELNRALRKDSTDSAVITAIIEKDMAIAAKILRLVNSAFFGLRRRVASLEQAVSLVGVRQIRDVVLATHIFSSFTLVRTGTELSLDRLREHSVAVGKLARSIMLEEGASRELADQAFVAGLLHSFGILVLASNSFSKYDKAIDYCKRKQRSLSSVEKVLFDVTHAEAGAYILGLWKIPPVIVEAVLMHQAPSQGGLPSWGPLAAVHVADALLHEDEGAPYPGAKLDHPFLKKLSLSARVDTWRLLAQAQLESETLQHES